MTFDLNLAPDDNPLHRGSDQGNQESEYSDGYFQFRDNDDSFFDYDQQKSYAFATLAGIFLGISNFIMAEQTKNSGVKSLYPQCIASCVIFVSFHLFDWFFGCFTDSDSSYWSLPNSAYSRLVRKDGAEENSDDEYREVAWAKPSFGAPFEAIWINRPKV